MLKTFSTCALMLVAGCSHSDSAGNCVDNDLDEVTSCDGDCDDNDPLTNPMANEICGDAIDNNCDLVPDEGCNGIGTFVSANTGADTNPGTKAAPVATIAAGIANAVTIGRSQTVLVAEGTYDEKVTLVEGVSLLGGFQCNASACDWARDSTTYDTVIANTDFLGVVANAGVTQATHVEGFHIIGKDGAPSAPPGSAGVTLTGGSPTLRGNRIFGGNVSGGAGFAADRSIGVALRETTDPAGAMIIGNTLTGGSSTGGSSGISFDAFGANPQTKALATVTHNVIVAGPARRSIGLASFNAMPGTLISGNDIAAGNSNGGTSIGVEVGGTLTIDGNRINLDQATVGICTNATTWCTGITSESSTTTITNNIVFGAKGARSAGVFLGEFEVAAGTVVLNANTLNGGGSGLSSGVMRTESAAVVVSIGTCNTCGFNGAVGRVRNNILDGGNNQNRYGVREDPAVGRTMRVEVLENNWFEFATATGRTDVLMRQVAANSTTTDHSVLANLNALTMPPATMNLQGGPLMDPTWHLMAGSACLNAGTATEAPAFDFEGEARPSNGGVDIGHDEMP